MLEGVCPNCGNCYLEWQLEDKKDQRCVNCGTKLDIWYGGAIVDFDDGPASNADNINPEYAEKRRKRHNLN